MKKNLGFKLAGATIVLIALILWALSLGMPEKFGGFNLAWTGFIIATGLAIILIIESLVTEKNLQLKNLKITFGSILLICAMLCIISALALPGSLVIPIIMIVATFGVIIYLLASRVDQKWDEGDNHQAGYKNYHERKKEQEEAKKPVEQPANNEENK